MQISANNLLIAAQQARAPQPSKPAVASTPEPTRQSAASLAEAGSPTQRPGSNLDIRV